VRKEQNVPPPTLWRAEAAGTLSSERHGLQLLVQTLEQPHSGAARFLIVRPGTRDHAKALLRSGGREDMQAAMAEAERMAERCVELGFLRTRAAR